MQATMRLEAVINEQGILTAQLPKSLWGKKVVVSVQVAPDSPAETVLDIFAEADKLDFPRRTHTEILADLRALRASE
jgi:hypothetical protein